MVAKQAFIKPPNSIAGFATEHPEIHRVNRSSRAASAVTGTTRADPRVSDCGNRTFKRCAPDGVLSSADIHRAGTQERRDRSADVPLRKTCVAIDPNNDFSSTRCDRRVETGRSVAQRVVDTMHLRVPSRKLIK